MALALRFAEEAEFSSRACDATSYDAPDVLPSKAFFRWSRPVRQLLGPSAHGPVHIKTLLIAMPGPAQQFVQHLTATWSPVGTLVTSDQLIPTCPLQPKCTRKAAVLLARTNEKVVDETTTLALIVGAHVPVETTWIWLKTLLLHVDADDIVCLDSQLSTIYADLSRDDKVDSTLRMLMSSSVTGEMKMQTLVRPLDVPQFVTGIPAALLTHGELRKRRVRVFVSLCDVSCTASDVMRSFLPLLVSVLKGLDRVLACQLIDQPRTSSSSLNVLYT